MMPLALTWLAGTLVTLLVANAFMVQAFDRSLLDDAYVVAANVKKQDGALELSLSPRELKSVLFDPVESVFFAIFSNEGNLVAGQPGLQAQSWTDGAPHKFANITFNNQSVRAVTLHVETPAPFNVVVAETTQSRNSLLQRLLAYCIAPQIVFLLLLAVWLRRGIARDLQPLVQLQTAMEQRDATDLAPVKVDASSRDIERLGGALNSLLERLDESGRAQREFTGNVAHEMRTPLAGIRALAEYGLAHKEPAVWQAQLQGIIASQARASRLIDQLLALALADGAKAGIQLAPVALDAMVHDSVMRYLPQADAQQVDLGARGVDAAVSVIGDASLIEGILNNLLDNALRYGQNTQGMVSSVTVALSRAVDGVTLSVIDNGPGLSGDMRSRLTQRWVQGRAGQLLGQGVGLGLGIVVQYAQLMNARLELGPGPDGQGLTASVKFLDAPEAV
ncbi:MAG: sensor histidine kinase N-terminal domain-containing protein [Bdellovibrionales bacterium]|nr:sensor histidine kinase N-terminal domain-containing protein [Ramlibacter sp.]